MSTGWGRSTWGSGPWGEDDATNVDLTGISATGVLAQVSVNPIMVYLTGLSATGNTGSILVWGEIPIPTNSWTTIGSGPTGGWVLVDSDQPA